MPRATLDDGAATASPRRRSGDCEVPADRRRLRSIARRRSPAPVRPRDPRFAPAVGGRRHRRRAQPRHRRRARAADRAHGRRRPRPPDAPGAPARRVRRRPVARGRQLPGRGFPAADVARRHAALHRVAERPASRRDAIRDALFVESPIAHPSAMIARRCARCRRRLPRHRRSRGLRPVAAPAAARPSRRQGAARSCSRWRDSPRPPEPHRSRAAIAARFFATKLAHFPDRGRRPARRCRSAAPARPAGAGRARCRARLPGPPLLRRRAAALGPPDRWRAGDAPGAPDRADGFVLAAAGRRARARRSSAGSQQSGLRPWDDYLAVA